jgi:hypothetical protein
MIRKIFDSASETALFFQEEIKLPHSVEEVESIWGMAIVCSTLIMGRGRSDRACATATLLYWRRSIYCR